MYECAQFLHKFGATKLLGCIGQPGWSVRACLSENCAHLHLELYGNKPAMVCVQLSERCDRPGRGCSAPAVSKNCELECRLLLSRRCAGTPSSSARRRAQKTAFCSAECVLALASAARGVMFQGTAFCSAGAVTGFCPSSTSLPWVLGLWTVLSGVTKGLPPCMHGLSTLSNALCQVPAAVAASLLHTWMSWEATAMQGAPALFRVTPLILSVRDEASGAGRTHSATKHQKYEATDKGRSTL